MNLSKGFVDDRNNLPAAGVIFDTFLSSIVWINRWKLKIQPGLNLYDRGMDTEKVQKSLSPFACLQ
jgi:hypothetical protein